uniref:Heat shock protein 70 n=1 Tax=Timspurckia oligopyrenoides TaxID=708627 RepID=A0A7S0ZCK6_9RHOD|mmetsp:Transcript_12508/g.22578  ORF Transcript_12508/g.22578 Transcript_12508/m.22578 type:complete len:846 (+) Transcript_12508:66-2603(+)
MSAAGIDFGNKNCVVALARRGGVDVIANEVSNRATPNMVSFSGEQRNVGESALTYFSQNFKNTVTDLKRFLGLRIGDSSMEAERKRILYEIKPFVDEQAGQALAGAEVNYGPDGGSPRIFSYESLVAMMLTNLMETALNANSAPVSDVVISVPGYYTDIQRRALLDAAKIAEVNVLRLLNEHAAVALSYGLFRTKELPDKDPIYVAFVDMGQSQTTVSVAAVLNSSVTVKAALFEPAIGSRNYEDALVEYLSDECVKNFKIDPRTKPRPLLRMRTESEKVKKVLSANAETILNVECLMDDTDVRLPVTRETFETLPLVQEMNSAVEVLCKNAVTAAGLQLSALHSVELVGGGTRVPSVIAAIERAFERAPVRTLNAEECIARGCALEAAILSPAFRVRDYALHDVTPYAVDIKKLMKVQDVKAEEVVKLIGKFNPMPALKALTFNNQGPLSIIAQYDDVSMADRNVCDYFIDAVVPTNPSKLRLKIRLDANGCVQLESAKEMIEYEVEEPEPSEDDMKVDPPVTEKPVTEKPATETPAGDAMQTDAPPAETEAQAPEKMEIEAPPGPETKKRTMKKVKKTKNVDVPIRRGKIGLALSDAALRAAIEEEASMRAADKYIRERSNAMNSLESYVYDMRSRIDEYGGDLKDFGAEEDRANLGRALEDMENWLYSEEAETASKGIFLEKRASLEAIFAPLAMRKIESENRPLTIKRALDYCSELKAVAVPNLERFEHLEDSEKNTVLTSAEQLEQWIYEMDGKQKAAPLSEDPLFTCAQLNAKVEEVQKLCTPIVNKPKPKPEPVAEPAPEPMVEEPKDSEMKTESAAEAGPAPEAMETEAPTESAQQV